MRKNLNEILDGLSWAFLGVYEAVFGVHEVVLGVDEMGKVDGGTEKADGRNGRKG